MLATPRLLLRHLRVTITVPPRTSHIHLRFLNRNQLPHLPNIEDYLPFLKMTAALSILQQIRNVATQGGHLDYLARLWLQLAKTHHSL